MSNGTKAPSVGSYVRDELKARGWTTLDAANQLEGNHETNEVWLNLICQDVIWESYDVAFGDHEAKLLEAIFGVEAQTWLNINDRFLESKNQ